MKYVKLGFKLGIGFALATIAMQLATNVTMYAIYILLQAFQNISVSL